MPSTDSLAALMKESPLNSVTLSAATHSKLRKALDGTGTQVATCIINRWTARMNGGEGYITTEILQGGRDRKRKRKTIVVLRTPKQTLAVKHQRTKKKNLSSDQARG